MTETSELVKRLRSDAAVFWGDQEKPSGVRLLAEEAADAIERLERERDEARLAGYAAAREQAAKVADDHDDGTSREGPLAAHTVAIAIRSMEPEEKK